MISREVRSKLCRIRKQLVDQLASVDELLDHQKEPDNCLNCEHFDNDFCKKWESCPPVNFIKKGCDEFIPIIPF